MRERAVLGRLACAGLLGAAACSTTPRPSLVPPQTVEMDAETLRKFQHEVEEYVELRQKALTKVPAVTPKATPEELSAHQKGLTQAIVAYRRGKKRGEIFKPDVEAAIRRTLQRAFTGPDGPALMKEVKQGNPKVEGNPLPQDPTKEVKKPVTLAVNAVYNDAAPFSSVPPSLLLKLPLLPEQVRYRFVGRAFILRDTEANVILDYIPDVVPDPSIPR
jgi:hypothetical protein